MTPSEFWLKTLLRILPTAESIDNATFAADLVIEEAQKRGYLTPGTPPKGRHDLPRK